METAHAVAALRAATSAEGRRTGMRLSVPFSLPVLRRIVVSPCRRAQPSACAVGAFPRTGFDVAERSLSVRFQRSD